MRTMTTADTARRARPAPSARTRAATLVVAALLAAACSGDDDSSTTVAPDPSNPVTDPATTPPTPSDPVDTPPVETTSPPTTVAATTTTEPPPEILPAGSVWTTSVVAEVPGPNTGSVTGTSVVGDTLWLTGSRYNAPVAWRSADAITFEEISIAPPPPNGALGIGKIVATASGRLVAHGSRATDCNANVDAGSGYRIVGLCRDFHPVVHLSDDGGATWRTVEPPAMAPPGGSSAVVEDMVVHGDQVIAAVTVRGPDWHGRLYSSPDGESWTLVGEFRGPTGPMSIDAVLSDGTTLAVLAAEHPCSEPSVNTPGWILGSDWGEHQRLFVGADTSTLAPLTASDLSIIPEPITYDCALVTGFDIGREWYPSLDGAVVGGRITLVDTTLPPPEEDGAGGTSPDDDTPPVEYTRRTVVQLVDGVWTTDVADGLPPGDPSDDTLLDVDGQVSLFRLATRPGGVDLHVLVLGEDGWSQPEPMTPVLRSPLMRAAGFAGGVVVTSREEDDPFDAQWTDGEAAELVVHRSVPTSEDDVPRCTLAPGASCRFQDLTLVEGYPDFSGLDLSGIDLIGSQLANADFSGANLSGAVMVDASSTGASFVGANLTGADLRDTTVGDVTGADLSLARLPGALINFVELPRLDGADVRDVLFSALDGAPPLSLAGLDLTGGAVVGPFDGIVVISDVTGASLEDVYFQRADLSTAVGFEGIDLTTFDVWDDSICPDGLPPTNGPIGTCAR